MIVPSLAGRPSRRRRAMTMVARVAGLPGRRGNVVTHVGQAAFERW
jgi:hypothetical protein